MKYLVCGSRDWSNWGVAEQFVRALVPGDAVAHGDARGADRMIHDLLTNRRNRQRGTMRARKVIAHGKRATGTRPGGRSAGDIDVHVYPADWVAYEHVAAERGQPNPAGVIRNGDMLSDFDPDACVYFHESLVIGVGGTGDMVERCISAGVIVYEAEDFIRMQRESVHEPENASRQAH